MMLPTERTARKPSFTSHCRGPRAKVKERLIHPLTRDYWPSCVALDNVARPNLLHLQQERLHALLRHVIAHTPYYRAWALQHGYTADDPPALAKWPIVTKSVIRSNFESFQSDGVPVREMSIAKTSGSSGEPFQLRVHRLSTDYSYTCFWRALRRHGIRPGDRRAYVWGRSRQFNSSDSRVWRLRVQQRLRDWLNNTLYVDAYDLNPKNVDDAIDRIERFRPTYLHGYVSALFVIARRMLDRNRRFRDPPLRAVIAESEKLYDFQRTAMSDAFGAPIIEHYGSIEFGNIAQADTLGRLRISDDLYVLETTSAGELLVTNLLSTTFPLIRYRLGDLAVLASPPDNDNLPYGMIADLKGRILDLVPKLDGGYVHSMGIAHAIDPHLRYVRKYQVHQTALDHFVVRLASDRVLPQETFTKIKRDLVTLFGPDVTIDMMQVDDIPPSSSGKFRWIISDISDVAERILLEQDK